MAQKDIKKERVLFYGFGPSYLIYSEFLKKCKWIKYKFCISQSSAFEKEEHKIFGKSNHFCIENIIIEKHDNYNVNPQFIDADKKRFAYKKGEFKDNYFESIYKVISKIFDEFKPDLIIYSKFIESPIGIILYQVAKGKNILCVVPHSLRFLGGTVFSNSPFERDIEYKEPKKLSKIKFQKESLPILNNPFIIAPSRKSLLKRISRIFYLVSKNSKSFTKSFFLWKFQEFIRYREFKRIINSYIYWRKSDEFSLNKKYIFYPLHVSPEASINTPSPYYVDQLRVIDLVRYHLPEDYLLYVKEHPFGFYKRKRGFYKQINKRSRVRLISSKVSTKDIILNSKCVVSVTGTACLEALCWGIPSVTITETFFSKFLINKLDDIKNKTLKKPKKNEINYMLNVLKYNSYDFFTSTPDYYYVQEKSNIKNLIKAYENFIIEQSEKNQTL